MIVRMEIIGDPEKGEMKGYSQKMRRRGVMRGKGETEYCWY